MICDRCGKREATIRYVQIINGNKQELHLCSGCGKEVGVDEFNMPMDFSNFFGDIFSDYNFPILNQETNLICKECNTSFNDFLNTGRFGCANCYKTFEKKLKPILKRIQGGAEYLGNSNIKESEGILKNSNTDEKEDSIRALENKLKKCIKEENYEEAAKIRDEIKNLKNEKGEDK